MAWIRSFFTIPGTGRLYWISVAMVQCTKLAIILSEPNSEQFKYWFYRCFQYPPYSWDCRTLNEQMPFPMPYSLMWYAVYVPLTKAGYWWFNLTMLTVDTLFIIVIARHHSQLYTYYYAQMSFYFLLVAPQDFVMWLFIVLARTPRPGWAGPFFLILSILWKFPLLPPVLDPAIWGFIFNNPLSVQDPLNRARYLLIGLAWLTSLWFWFTERSHIHERVQRRLIPSLR